MGAVMVVHGSKRHRVAASWACVALLILLLPLPASADAAATDYRSVLPGPLAGGPAVWTGHVAYVFRPTQQGNTAIDRFDALNDSLTTLAVQVPDDLTDAAALWDGSAVF